VAAVQGRLTAPQGRIIHTGQVVQNQGGGVGHFDRATEIQGVLGPPADVRGGQHGHDRPDPLARSQQGLARGEG